MLMFESGRPVKYVPSWLPGMGWKRFAEETASISHEMVNKPFEFVKNSIVRIPLQKPSSVSRADALTRKTEPRALHSVATV